ncbi:MAG: 30S ribosomal protein S6 [Candidatus Levybacteria bacterium CG_4_9_14_3_um_filter_35_16]|nr:MAG: 30S ribosomal protein S6 [Candidatus Levybacteria bacterium CG22_combo_CG10-13_8_21_14_all_35_11]PIY94585.1 MAG: 30S ribosomal protein S6 [Candidatus Levybacteria bacterium CG_4_10_14_0_8_um_filter_35_23]PJA90995.1 MAG: 30S ribosomal protein S6 [Candidatus Levybacteria bacterium CG_4_9_14_3_um_filter_35_16]PJC53997.1 MAG: 30S ribosomal protein S6 [Candidatus Levybacteria bacterium CG_4_9_14_0_2_um_filter_35_21]
MRNYQLVLVLRPSLSESERKKVTETVKGWLKDVKISKDEEWGQKALAYKIKKENAGFYLNYELEAEVIPGDFEKRIIGQDAILRHLLIRVQSAKLKVKSEKEEKAKKEDEGKTAKVDTKKVSKIVKKTASVKMESKIERKKNAK